VTELARLIAVRYKEIEKALGGPLPDCGFWGRKGSTASSTSTRDDLNQSYGQLPGLNSVSDHGHSSLDSSSSHSGWGNGAVATSGDLGQLEVPEGRLNLDDVDGFWEGTGDAAMPESHHRNLQGIAAVASQAGGISRHASVGHSAGAVVAERQAQQQQQNHQDHQQQRIDDLGAYYRILYGSTTPSMSSTGMFWRMGRQRLSLPDIADAQAAAALGAGLDGYQYHPSRNTTAAGLAASLHGHLSLPHGGGKAQPDPRHLALRHSMSLPVQKSSAPSSSSTMSRTSPGDGQVCGINAAWATGGESPAPVVHAPNTSASFTSAMPPPQHHHHLSHDAPATMNPSPTGGSEIPASNCSLRMCEDVFLRMCEDVLAAGVADPSDTMFCQLASEPSQSCAAKSPPLPSLLGQATTANGVNTEALLASITSRDVDSPNRSALSSGNSTKDLLQKLGDGGPGSAGTVDFKDDDIIRMLKS